MSVPSQLLKSLGPLAARLVPAGSQRDGCSRSVTGAGSAFVATQFQNAAPFVLIAMFVAPLLAIGIIVNPLLATLVVIATYPIGNIAQSVGPLRIQVVEVAVFVAALVVVLRRLAVGRIPLPFAAPLGWAVALFLWTLISLFSAIDEKLAIKVLFSLLGGIVCATVVLAGCRDMRDLRILLAGFVGSGVVIGLITFSEGRHVGQFSTEFGGSEIVSGRLQGAFDSPNQLGSFCALMIPVAAALIFGARTARWRFAAGMALLVLLATLMLSLSRGAWVGVAIALLLMLVKLKEARRLLVILAIPLVILGFFIWSLTPTKTDVKVVGERARALTVLSPYDDRRVIYKEAYPRDPRAPRPRGRAGRLPGREHARRLRVGDPLVRARAQPLSQLGRRGRDPVGPHHPRLRRCARARGEDGEPRRPHARRPARQGARDRNQCGSPDRARPGVLRLRDPEPRHLHDVLDAHGRAARGAARRPEDPERRLAVSRRGTT